MPDEKSLPPAPRLPREVLEGTVPSPSPSEEPPSISVSPSMPVLDSEPAEEPEEPQDYGPAVSLAPDNVYVADVLPKRSPVMAPKLDGSLSGPPPPVDLFPAATATGMYASTGTDVVERLNQLDWQLQELKQEVEVLKKKTWLQIIIETFRRKSNA